MSLQIKVLGSLKISDGYTVSPLMNSAKGCALVSYLLISDQVQQREQVADLLWNATSTRSSLSSLRELLVRVKKELPELKATRKTLALLPSETITADLWRLRAALDTADATQLDKALALYQGDLLGSFYLPDGQRFNEWLILERERLRLHVFEAYERLCNLYEEQKEWSVGARAAQRWLLLDELNEEAYRQLMRFLMNKGQISAARDVYEQCQQVLWRELHVEPSAETAALNQRLEEWPPSLETSKSRLVLPPPGTVVTPSALPSHSYLPYHRNPDFTGREANLQQLAQWLLPWPESEQQVRVAAVSGMGGIGKTQLAVEFAHRYGRFFAGGVYWVSMADANSVAEEASIIGGERGMRLYRAADQLTLADRVGRIQQAWQAAVPRLLIFDNCEDTALLNNWLPVTGGCRVLVTCRRAQWPRELNVAQLPLQVWHPTESGRFLRRLVPRLNEEEAAAITNEVGHLPLALHLAGGFLHRYPHLSAEVYLEQLQQTGLVKHPSLQGQGTSYSPTAHERHIIDTFAVSLAQLETAETSTQIAKRLLAAAVCFAPGEPIPVRFLSVPVGDSSDWQQALLVEEALSRLITLGLVRLEGERLVVVHRLVAAFTKNSLQDTALWSDTQTAVEALIVQTLEAQLEKDGHLSTLPFSTIHLRHITEKAFERQPIMATAVALAIFLGRHLRQIGNFDDAQRMLRQAHVVARAIGDELGQIHALTALAMTQENLGYDEASLESAAQAIALLRQRGDVDAARLSVALYRKGWAHFRQGQAEAALQCTEEALAIGLEKNNLTEIARNLSLMGVVSYYLLGRYEEANHHLAECLTIYQKLGNERGEASVLNNMGENARLQGDYGLARSYYERSIAVSSKSGNHNLEKLVLSNLCGALIALEEFKTAASHLEPLIADTKTDWFGFSEAYRFLSEAYLGLNRVDEALAMVQQALDWAQNPQEHGRAWRVLGLIAGQRGQSITVRSKDLGVVDFSSRDCFKQALTYFESLDLGRDQALTLWRWAECELNRGNRERGVDLWYKARAIFESLRLPLFVARMDELHPMGEF